MVFECVEIAFMELKPFLLIVFLLAANRLSLLGLEPVSERIVVMISVDGLAHYYLDDPKADMPVIRRMAMEGARAQKMKVSLPSVTWPNHTTLVTGVEPARHGVLGNNVFDREKNEVLPLIVDPVLDKDEIVASPTIYDLAKESGLRTASILWPATRGASSLDWNLPEVSTDELIEKYTTPGLLKEFSESGIPPEMNVAWRSKPEMGRARDRLFMQMFTHVVRVHRPNLALLHLVDLDHVEHAHGPQSPEAYSLVKFEDEMIGEIRRVLEAEFPGKATLIVTSDHGFFPYRQQILPNVLLRQEGLLTEFGGKISGGQVRALSQGGACFIYILDDKNREALRMDLETKLAAMEGVDWAIGPEKYPEYGLADPSKNPHMADLVLSAKEGYAFSDKAAGDLAVTPLSDEMRGTHGYDADQPKMHATFIAWGAGIKAGTSIGDINNTSVAPTVGALLGIQMPDADGKPLEAILGE